ncbi:MAG: Nuclease-related domain protein, partial [Nocardioides sp.]|nr:Nuclease-related domain protein [Nocardioides sp.]
NGKDARIFPVDQARDSKHPIRRYVESDPRWGTRGHVAWAHGVVAPHAEFGNDFQVPELPRWALHDKNEQVDLVARLRDNARGLHHGNWLPSQDDVDLIVEILAGRMHTSYDVNAEAAERASESDRLTHEQSTILQVTRLLKRVEVRGGAGSGKTVLALQQAKELTRGRAGERPAQRVALLCYSIGLAEYLKRQVAGWNRNHRPAFVGTFHELGREWGAPDGSREDSDFWEIDLPRMMGELVWDLPDGKKYDSIIVDEAQDFADSWWPPVLKSLRDEVEGGVYVYSDENQRIFARFGRPPVHLVPLVLDHNLRNTKQIHESFGPLAPSRMYARGGDGPAVRFVRSTAEDATGVADDEVDALLDVGWSPGNIALLTTGHRHNLQQEATGIHGHQGYWRAYFEGEDVFYGHVLGCKGLERPAVVLCVNEAGERDRARERLYVGMSRATDMLVVVGDPVVIERVGGSDVARRLGIG